MGDITVKGANKIFGKAGFSIARNEQMSCYEATHPKAELIQSKTLVELCQKIVELIVDNTYLEY